MILVIFTIGIASASDNITSGDDLSGIGEIPVSESIDNNDSSQIVDEAPAVTKMETKDVNTYYKENFELVGYLKDDNNRPVSNKNISISINDRLYNKISDDEGKVVLKLNLKPGTYTAVFKFAGDENYTASSVSAAVKVDKATLKVISKNYKTYWHSGLYFKAKVINKFTKNPVSGVKVAFKVFEKNKYKTYYATTDANGIAKLRKNFKVGSYKVITKIKKNKNINSNKKSRAILTIKKTAETGCCSLYVHVSNSEAVAGFRRDATNAVNIKIVKYKLNGKTAIKQYKKGSYFFHSITSADGWMAGTGGIDNPTINKAIEKLAGKMFKSGEIKKSYLKKIKKYERILGLGHFSIKAPNGKYALVWKSTIKTGKLKPGEFLSVPNSLSCYRHGNWAKYSKNPVNAAIKVAASDSFGVNRRDVTAFHWKATTSEGKTTSQLKVYAANDNGHAVGKSTGHLKDNVYFKGKFFSKNRLPKTPSKLLLGVQNFGSIDKLIKTQTEVNAPKLTKNINQSATFDVKVKNKKTKKPVKNLKLKLKINDNVYTIKTGSNGVAKFNTKDLSAGTYPVLIYSDNIRYYVSAKSTIRIS